MSDTPRQPSGDEPHEARRPNPDDTPASGLAAVPAESWRDRLAAFSSARSRPEASGSPTTPGRESSGEDPAGESAAAQRGRSGGNAEGTPAAAASHGSTAGGSTAGGSTAGGTATGGGRARRVGRQLFGWAAPPSGPLDARQRRQRRWFVAAISVGAAIIVIALCAGALSVVSAVDDVRDRATDARDDRRRRDLGCLELEERLNRLTPPGATAGPAARADAIRDENLAVRIYVGQLPDPGDQDAWRQLLDARTAYADALDRQARSRTRAFYVAPRTPDGRPVADDLQARSPAPCAGSLRRLAAPDL